MMEFIRFLDCHEGSLMVLITAIYVLATILICWANIKSAQAAREQIAEARRQYEEENRPRITYEMSFVNRQWYGMRFINHGRRVAIHVQISFNQDFLSSISECLFSEALNSLQNKEFTLGVGQSYDIFFGMDEFRNNPSKKPIEGEIIYQDGRKTYQESFQIDWDRYATFWSVNTPTDDFLDNMKKLVNGLDSIAHALKLQQPTPPKKGNEKR